MGMHVYVLYLLYCCRLEGKVLKTRMGNETEVKTMPCKGNAKTFTVVQIDIYSLMYSWSAPAHPGLAYFI